MSSVKLLQQVHYPSATGSSEGQSNEIRRPTILSSSHSRDSTFNSNSSTFPSSATATAKTSTAVDIAAATTRLPLEAEASTTDEATPTARIAFGSCNNQGNQNNLWPIIESRKPVAFVWGGDAIYAGKQGSRKLPQKIAYRFYP